MFSSSAALLSAALVSAMAVATPQAVKSQAVNSQAVKSQASARSAKASRTPITDALEALGKDVQVYNDHVVTLSSPFMDGRLPGTNGMRVAKDYCEYWLKKAGVGPAFRAKDGKRSFRQPFPLGGTLEVKEGSLRIEVEEGGALSFERGKDFTVMGLGSSAKIEGPLVFAGYGIARGRSGYSSFADDDDFTGKVVLVLRFEPMNDSGKSKWVRRGAWSSRASFDQKVRALTKRGAKAILIANAPGAADPRSKTLTTPGGGGRRLGKTPVFHLSTAAADRLVRKLDPKKRSLMEFRQLADEGRIVADLPGKTVLSCELQRKSLIGENVGGLLQGRGELADEVIVIGAHLDHLGMGLFGSRSGPGKLHPGADDNASGSAAILMLAEKLARRYEQLPEGQPARSVLFVLFSGEESGLNGSRKYVNDPIRPLEKHALMINFDMIGRIKNKRLRVAGIGTAKGMSGWLKPILEASPLDCVTARSAGGGSDHMMFASKKVPVLFSIIADFHGDYHTPKDVSWKINRVDAVHTVHLYEKIAFTAATRGEAFEWQSRPRGTRPAAGGRSRVPGAKIQFGIMPASYDESELGGVAVQAVTDGAAAQEAGVLAGDRLVSWNGKKIADVRAWMGMLVKHKPGDKVKVGILRGKKRIELNVTLRSPAGRR